MSKESWGANLWHILHVIAKSFPEKPTINDKNTAYQLVKYLATILPCQQCQKHYMSNFTKVPPNLKSGKEFFIWTVKIHNSVNKLNNSKTYTPVQAFNITPNVLNSTKMSTTFSYLVKEAHISNVSKIGLTKFIDCLTYLSRYSAGSWSLPENRDITTRQIHNRSYKNNFRMRRRKFR